MGRIWDDLKLGGGDVITFLVARFSTRNKNGQNQIQGFVKMRDRKGLKSIKKRGLLDRKSMRKFIQNA